MVPPTFLFLRRALARTMAERHGTADDMNQTLPPNRNLRVAVVTGPPAPYRQPVFAELDRRPGIELCVFHASNGHQDLGWQATDDLARDYDYVFLENFMPARGRRLPVVGYLSLGMPAELHSFAPDYLIVYGYNQLSQWLAFRYAITHQVPFALRSDSNVHLDVSQSWKSSVRRRLLQPLIRRAHAVLPVGSANRAYWERYGAQASQIFMAPYAVDNTKVSRLLGDRPIRKADSPLHLLYVGRLMHRKGVDLLLEAFNQFVEQHPAFLTIIGEGPERTRLESMQTESAPQRTLWRANCPMTKPFGQCGTPISLSFIPLRAVGTRGERGDGSRTACHAHRKVGAAIDLVEDSVHGWLLEELTCGAILSALRQRPKIASICSAWRKRRQRVEGWSIRGTVDGMLAAVRDGCRRNSQASAEREVMCG